MPVLKIKKDGKWVEVTGSTADTIEATGIILKSSIEGSSKQFLITIDDDGVLTATAIVEA